MVELGNSEITIAFFFFLNDDKCCGGEFLPQTNVENCWKLSFHFLFYGAVFTELLKQLQAFEVVIFFLLWILSISCKCRMSVTNMTAKCIQC